MQTTINGKTYTVETTGNDKAPYLFHGQRGATLGAIRDARNGLLQILNTRNWQDVGGWYTDQSGTIERA